MSCFPEATWAVYVDGELDPKQTRAIESHLVGCRTCRALVVALRDEADALSDAVHERQRERAPASRPAAEPARGLALGVMPSLALVAAALAGLGWLFEAGLPAAIEWMNPFRSSGAYEMAFDLIFLMRDQAPGLLELGVALAATASASAILTFALTVVLRRWSGPGAALLLGLALVGAPAPSEAHFGMHAHEGYTLGAGEIHDGTLIVSGGTADIDGEVAGDLLVLSERLVIRGVVKGNVYALVQTLEAPGVIEGSLHVGSERADVAGSVGGNLYAGAEQFTLGRGGKVERDLAIWVEDGVLEGEIGRDVYAGGRNLEIRGEIARNLRAWWTRVALVGAASVGGDFTSAHAPGREPQIAATARVAGEVESEVQLSPMRVGFDQYLQLHFWLWTAIRIAGAFAVGMLLHWLLPALFSGRVESAGAFFRVLGMGLVTLVAAPIILVLIGITIAGIPVALIGFALYLSCLFVAIVMAGELVGGALVHPEGGRGGFGLALLVGLVIVIFAIQAPYLGTPARIVALLCGLGLIVERSADVWRGRRLAA